MLVSTGSAPFDFVELNEVPSSSRAKISHYDGSIYTEIVGQDLATGFHTGPVELQFTGIAGTSVTLIQLDVKASCATFATHG